jgi:hypothetical protein
MPAVLKRHELEEECVCVGTGDEELARRRDRHGWILIIQK